MVRDLEWNFWFLLTLPLIFPTSVLHHLYFYFALDCLTALLMFPIFHSVHLKNQMIPRNFSRKFSKNFRILPNTLSFSGLGLLIFLSFQVTFTFTNVQWEISQFSNLISHQKRWPTNKKYKRIRRKGSI